MALYQPNGSEEEDTVGSCRGSPVEITLRVNKHERDGKLLV